MHFIDHSRVPTHDAASNMSMRRCASCVDSGVSACSRKHFALSFHEYVGISSPTFISLCFDYRHHGRRVMAAPDTYT